MSCRLSLQSYLSTKDCFQYFSEKPKWHNICFEPFRNFKIRQSQVCSSWKVSENSKRTPSNDRRRPLHDCPQAPEQGATSMSPCPRRLAPEVQRPSLALCKWVPSVTPSLIIWLIFWVYSIFIWFMWCK